MRLWNALRLVLLVQRRSRFLHVYLGVAVLTVLVIRLLIPEDLNGWVVPAVLLGEPGTLGILLVAAYAYLERNEQDVLALTVTPLRRAEYVAALSVGTALVATLAGVIIFGGVLGLDARIAWLVPPLFLTATLFGLVGLALSSWFSEFTRCLLGGIPVIVLLHLPFLALFELVPRFAFVWVPSDASVFAFANLALPAPDPLQYGAYCALLVAYNGAGFWAVAR